jgi:hypothetical protein
MKLIKTIPHLHLNVEQRQLLNFSPQSDILYDLFKNVSRFRIDYYLIIKNKVRNYHEID